MKNRNIFHWEFGTEKPGAVSKVSLEMLETQELVSAFRCGRGVISWRRKHEEFYWIEDGWEGNNAEGGHAEVCHSEAEVSREDPTLLFGQEAVKEVLIMGESH